MNRNLGVCRNFFSAKLFITQGSLAKNFGLVIRKKDISGKSRAELDKNLTKK